MKITQEELRTYLFKALEKMVDQEAAEYFTAEVIEAHFWKSPRSNVLSGAIKDIVASNGKDQITYSVDLPSYVAIDFKGQGPLVYLKQIHDELERRANRNGLAMAAFTNSQSMHTLHTWVQGLAKRGLLAIAVCNGGPRSVVPFNGTEGIFGTNPIAYGLPGKDGEIFCVDMATSEIPYFEILNAQENKQPLRERSAVDNKGEFTTDPKEALDYSVSKVDPTSNIVPMGGGYKGYNLVYLMEVLTSALIGMPASTEMSTDFVPEEHGAILVAFSPKAFGTEQTFHTSIASLNSTIRKQRPKAGETIRIPGEHHASKKPDNEIEVSEELLTKLKTASN